MWQWDRLFSVSNIPPVLCVDIPLGCLLSIVLPNDSFVKQKKVSTTQKTMLLNYQDKQQEKNTIPSKTHIKPINKLFGKNVEFLKINL